MEKKRILIDGVFDMFSVGHMKMLERLKSDPNNYVIVGVIDDEEAKNNNILTVMTGYERCETLKHSRFLDEVIYPCPFIITKEFVNEHNIHAIGNQKWNDRYSLVADIFFTLQHEEGASTSNIVDRILNQYDEYAERTLSRGYSYRDIGLKDIEVTCLFLRLGYHKIHQNK